MGLTKATELIGKPVSSRPLGARSVIVEAMPINSDVSPIVIAPVSESVTMSASIFRVHFDRRKNWDRESTVRN